MRTAQRAWRPLAGGPALPVVTAAVIPVVAALVALAVAAPAAANTPARVHAQQRPHAAAAAQRSRPGRRHAGRHDAHHARRDHIRRARRHDAHRSTHPGSGGLALRTLVGGLHVHSRPSVYAPIVSQIRKRGATIIVNCWSSGPPISGNPVWYHINQPAVGFVTAFYVGTHYDPAAGVRQCSRIGFRRQYWTLEGGLRIRTQPRKNAATVARMGGMGSVLTIDCYAYGGSLLGDKVWYQVVSPREGYVPGLRLNTGQDPAAGVPAC
ncbi:MAG: hypothetical protein ACLQDY_00010 [Streptosporangiaceae bacterium]